MNAVVIEDESRIHDGGRITEREPTRISVKTSQAEKDTKARVQSIGSSRASNHSEEGITSNQPGRFTWDKRTNRPRLGPIGGSFILIKVSRKYLHPDGSAVMNDREKLPKPDREPRSQRRSP